MIPRTSSPRPALRRTTYTIYTFLVPAFLILVSTCRAQDAATDLYRISEHGRYGFIDGDGTVVIAPTFRGAGNFSEGLAPVRSGGLYGFIDRTGTFVIPPQFDAAFEFSEGIAPVWMRGKLRCIRRDGSIAFPTPYTAIAPFNGGRAHVVTASGHHGIIDTNGRLVVDTVYHHIGTFNSSRAVVIRIDTTIRDGRQHFQRTTGVIDTTGRMVVPPGTYERIEDFNDALAYFDANDVDPRTGKTVDVHGYIDVSGRRMEIPFSSEHWLSSNRRDDLAVLYCEGTAKGRSTEDYQGIVDMNGRILLNDPQYRIINLAGHHLAFARDHSFNTYLISATGRRITQEQYSGIQKVGFQDGLAFVLKGGWWGAIDITGRFVIPPRYLSIGEGGLRDGKFLFAVPDTTGRDSDEAWGIADRNGTELTPPVFDRILSVFPSGNVLSVVNRGRFGYARSNGRMIWQEPARDTSLMPGQVDTLNIDVMRRCNFMAYSSSNEMDEHTLTGGGWYQSPNMASRKGTSAIVGSDTFALVARPEESAVLNKEYAGFRLYVANTTHDTLVFDGINSSLYMTVQARDEEGKWRDIEYVPQSWCGNSYHLLQLKPGEHWTLTVPRYQGATRTQMRVALIYYDPRVQSWHRDSRNRERKQPVMLTIYSNEFEGGVNPGQFWRKQGHTPQGLMDPYNE